MEECIRVGLEEGEMVVAQVPLSSDLVLEIGFFVRSTLFTGVRREIRIAQEEIFCPVVTVTRFGRYEEAIEVANESEYGLMCGIYTRDMTKSVENCEGDRCRDGVH
jgi:acyl-CoA reductase-like NAD-dependent aldehyde dehydrogenase